MVVVLEEKRDLGKEGRKKRKKKRPAARDSRGTN
jgi:hypothetical protein